jgi:AraC family transcriptional regulator
MVDGTTGMEPFVFARVDLGPVVHGCLRTVIKPLPRQPAIPTPGHSIFFPRTATWARPEGRARYLCDPGLVSFWSRGQVCLREPAASPAVDGEFFGLSPALAEEVVALADPGASSSSGWLFRYQAVPVGPGLFLRQRRLAAAIQAGSIEREQAVEAIVCLASDCVALAAGQAGPSSRTARRDGELVEVVRLRVAADPSARPGLAAMAADAGVGMVTLCTAFRRITGRSIHAYRLDLRLQLALERLERSTGDLSDVALELGFDSHSHFSLRFRERFGAAPSRVRADLSALGRLRLKERDSARSRGR